MRASAAMKKRTVKVWHESSGYWADLKRGLRCIAADTHTCREDTLPELERAVAQAAVCNCDYCTATAIIEAAARWAEDEFDRRTRLLEEDSLPRIDWINPEYRVCWSEIVDRFFSDGTVKDWPSLRIEYDAARKQELKKRKKR